MNCHDIASILDESEQLQPSRAAISALEAHLSQCADCADQYLVSLQMSSFRNDVPPLPESLRERFQRLHDRAESQPGPGQARRPVIIGSLLLLGAAATMFASVSWRDVSAASPRGANARAASPGATNSGAANQ